MSESSQSDKMSEKLKGPREFLDRHRIAKAASSVMLKVIVRLKFGRDFDDPAINSGFLEGSIIGNPLRYPNPEESGLTNKRVGGGSWVGYDFRRPYVFPKAHERGEAEQLYEGRFFGVILEEVKDNPPDQQTPLGLLHLSNIDQLLQFDSYTAAELLDLGVLAEKSYGQAYENVGLYGEYADELKARSIIDEPVFQITPKGNTLVMLVEDGGDPQPDEKTQPSFAWLPGIRPAL